MRAMENIKITQKSLSIFKFLLAGIMINIGNSCTRKTSTQLQPYADNECINPEPLSSSNIEEEKLFSIINRIKAHIKKMNGNPFPEIDNIWKKYLKKDQSYHIRIKKLAEIVLLVADWTNTSAQKVINVISLVGPSTEKINSGNELIKLHKHMVTLKMEIDNEDNQNGYDQMVSIIQAASDLLYTIVDVIKATVGECGLYLDTKQKGICALYLIHITPYIASLTEEIAHSCYIISEYKDSLSPQQLKKLEGYKESIQHYCYYYDEVCKRINGAANEVERIDSETFDFSYHQGIAMVRFPTEALKKCSMVLTHALKQHIANKRLAEGTLIDFSWMKEKNKFPSGLPSSSLPNPIIFPSTYKFQ